MFVDPVSVYPLDFVVTLNDYSHDSVDPRVPILSLPPSEADLAVLEADGVQEVPEVVDLMDPRELQDHQRKQRLVEMDN